MLREPAAIGADSLRYARRGYAVVDVSARGFGRSCGVAGSRTPECARGWTHLYDQRYEARDVQHLLGRSSTGDRPAGALGVAGEAGAGIIALELAFLRNRVREPAGGFFPGAARRAGARSPPRCRPAGHDLLAALLPNGRFLDFAAPRSRAPTPLACPGRGGRALLAPKSFVAPRGADPAADPRGWKAVSSAATLRRGRAGLAGS